MLDTIALKDVLLAGAKEVFETMIFIDIAECCEPDRKPEGEKLLGSITFKNSIKGCLVICCSIPCAKGIAINMLGMEPTAEISKEEICDALGEVTNMIMGSIKSRIHDSIGDIQVSIPTVVSGRELESSLGEDANKITLRLNIEDRDIMELSLLYKQNPE